MQKTDIQIRFSDMDMLGHVNNVAYGYYFDIARVKCLEQILGKIDWKEGQILALVRTETDFKQSVYFDDEIEIQSSITNVGNRSIKMHQALVDKKGNVKAESRSVLSTFNTKTNESFPLSEEWKQKFNAIKRTDL